MNQQDVEFFAKDWIDSWNSHDLESIVEHYADDAEFTSPFIVKLFNELSGTIHGKQALRSYFQKGLEAYPALHFELINVLTGVNSIVLYYRSVNNLTAAETMHFNENGKVFKVSAHYLA